MSMFIPHRPSSMMPFFDDPRIMMVIVGGAFLPVEESVRYHPVQLFIRGPMQIYNHSS